MIFIFNQEKTKVMFNLLFHHYRIWNQTPSCSNSLLYITINKQLNWLEHSSSVQSSHRLLLHSEFWCQYSKLLIIRGWINHFIVLIRGRQIVPNIREGVYTECRVSKIISNRALGGTFLFCVLSKLLHLCLYRFKS